VNQGNETNNTLVLIMRESTQLNSIERTWFIYDITLRVFGRSQ